MNTAEQEKPVHPEMHVDGVRFALYKNGEVWARTKDLPAEKVSTLWNATDDTPWKPSHKNFNGFCKQFVRDGDVDHLIKRQKKISKERGMKRNAGVELFEALDELVLVNEICDETGYVDGEGFVDIEAALDKARAALAKARGET
ncbi:hypothetical protein Q8G38_16225 [Halomonas venusta]|uniref:hypothetical protein n=1 Tax=Vreelandella venusta TaxID=44935 RepID=UPI00295F2BD9|nr:hypothetical protein [Halomonas venusta]MDW0360861.1 hypothetical protein [Halomonas venusta]